MTNIKNILLNQLLLKGKKRTTQKIVFKSIKYIQKKSIKDCKSMIKSVFLDSSPVTQIKKIRRKNRETKEFPIILKKKLRLNYGIKYLISGCRTKSSNPMFLTFSNEIIGHLKNNKTLASETIHEESFIKKKYAKYRWF